jgi:hypothetical protein
MEFYYLIGISGGTLFILLVMLLRQIMTKSSDSKSTQHIEELLTQLAKQNHATEQQLRENLLINLNNLQQVISEKLGNSQLEQVKHSGELKEQLQQAFSSHRARFDERQLEALKILQDTLQKGVLDNRTHIKESLTDYAKELGKRVDQLTCHEPAGNP